MSKLLRVGITHGDINGIGYELILRTLADPELLEICTPVIFGSARVAQAVQRHLHLEPVPFRLGGLCSQCLPAAKTLLQSDSRHNCKQKIKKKCPWHLRGKYAKTPCQDHRA